MDHALKGELAKIEWCVHLLRQRGAEDHELEIIQNSAQHLRQFAERTRLCSEDIVLSCTFCDIRSLLQEAAAPIDGHAPPIQITHCDDVPLYCDETHLMEVLHNLISNAVDAAGNGGVTLSYRAGRGRAEIEVRDNGPGIPLKEQAYLFEPYYTTKKDFNNLGLGLYYCWNVMAAHRGSIQVVSAPGKGTAFKLIFPLKRRGKHRPEVSG